MSIAIYCAGSFFAGWMLCYFTARRECENCLNARLQRQEWNRTSHLDPKWDVLPRSPVSAPMPPVKPTKGPRHAAP
jgi:hypothetical protein